MKKLLILGGASVHVKVVRAAREMGVYTIVTDYLDDSPAKAIADRRYDIDVRDVDGVVRMCREERVDGVIGPYLDPCQRPYYQICHRLGLPCYIDTWEQVFTLTDKDAFKRCCAKNGVDVIPTYDIARPEDIAYPVLVKPGESRGSRGQAICHNYEELKRAHAYARAISDSGEAIVERYMGGKNDFTMTYFFVNGEAHLIKTSDRYLGPEESMLNSVAKGFISPSRFTDAYLRNIDARVTGMLRALGIQNGPVFMQGFIDGDTVRFYDPGFRFPGSDYDLMLRQITGLNLSAMLIEFALTGKMREASPGALDRALRCGGHSFATFYPALRPGTIREFQGVDQVSKLPGLMPPSFRHNIGDVIEPTGDVNQRLAEINVICEDEDALRRALRCVSRELRVLDERGRNMICCVLGEDDLDRRAK